MSTIDIQSIENNDGSQSDNSGGAESTASATSSLSPKVYTSRTSPNCNKCKNHKKTELLRGHKRYCEFRHCKCPPCLLTEERRKVMAAQTRQKRAQIQDEKAGVPLEERAPVLPARDNATLDLSFNPLSLDLPHSTSDPVRTATKRKFDNLEDQKEASYHLIKAFGVAKSALPFALVIFRKTGDLQIAKNLILDAQKEILERVSREQASLFPHGSGYVPEAHSYAHSNPLNPYRAFVSEGSPIPLAHEPSRRPYAPTPRH